MNIKKNLRNTLLSSFITLFSVLSCSPSLCATKPVKEGLNTKSNDHTFQKLRKSIKLKRTKKFEYLPIKGITYGGRIYININDSLHHICYGNVKNNKITSGGHLGFMKKFAKDLKSKSFFSEKYNQPEDIRKLIIENIQKTNFICYDELMHNKSHSSEKVYTGIVKVPYVGNTIDGTVLHYLEFVVLYDYKSDNCVLKSCYPI